MNKDGFNKLFLGFLFVMLDIRAGGFDILPDIVGYLLFAVGLGKLIDNGWHFSKAKGYTLPLMFLSLFHFYAPPMDYEGGIDIGPFGLLGIIVGLVSFVFGLLFMYHLFMGIKDMAKMGEDSKEEIYCESERRWKQYLFLNIATLAQFVVMFIPFINIFYSVAVSLASIVLMVKFMKFMKKCSYSFY